MGSLFGRVLLVMVPLSFTVACASNDHAGGSEKGVASGGMAQVVAPAAEMQGQDMNAITVTGVWVYKEFEGGFCGIETDSGEKYFPLNPPKDCRDKAGTAVTIKAEVKRDIVTFQMWGTPVKVLSYE